MLGSPGAVSLAQSMVEVRKSTRIDQLAPNDSLLACEHLAKHAHLGCRFLSPTACCKQDIINGAFKGFAMLRQTAYMLNDPLAPPFDPPLYVPRYGFVARNQVRNHHVPDTSANKLVSTRTFRLAQHALCQLCVCFLPHCDGMRLLIADRG